MTCHPWWMGLARRSATHTTAHATAASATRAVINRGPPPPTPQAPRTMPRTDEHRRVQPATPSSLCFERAHLPCYESPTTSSPSAQQLRACATRTVAEILEIWPSVSSKQRSSRYGAGPGGVRVVVDAAHGHASRHEAVVLSSSNAVSRNPHATRSTHSGPPHLSLPLSHQPRCPP